MAILTPDKTDWIPRHLLLMGNTKTGKTRYLVEAIRDGYECIYVDADNGLTTIKAALANAPEALSRLHYFEPGNIEAFIADFLTAGVFRYNETRRVVYNATDSAPSDSLCEIYPGRIPQRVILGIDSWTSLCYRAMKNQASRKTVDLQDIDKYSREIYGGAGFQITQIASMLQTVRFGVVVLAHGAQYERKKKPIGIRTSEVKESEMVIVETLLVPISTSLPHGYTIGKHFNEIGFLYVKPVLNTREIDFGINADRVSGGTPGSKGDPMVTHRYSMLFGKPPAKAENEPRWIRYLTVAELKEEAAKAKATAGAAPRQATPIPQPKVAAGGIILAAKKV